MRHVVLFCDVHATDGLDDVPLRCVEVIGIADDDVAAIDMMTAHHAANPFPVDADRRRYVMDERMTFLRGGGPKGEDVVGGFRTHGRGSRDYYRAVPVRDPA